MRAALITALLLLTLVAGTASAHVRSTAGYSEIRLEGGTVRYELSLERSILRAASGHAPSPEAYLLPRVRVFLDGVECEGALGRTGIESRQGRDYDRVTLDYRCPGSPSGTYAIRYGVFADGGVVDDHSQRRRLPTSAASAARSCSMPDTASSTSATRASSPSARRFAGLGVEHILSGIDHVLFLVALLLGASGFANVLKLATAFTAAHSVTLALGALGWVQVPAGDRRAADRALDRLRRGGERVRRRVAAPAGRRVRLRAPARARVRRLAQLVRRRRSRGAGQLQRRGSRWGRR